MTQFGSNRFYINFILEKVKFQTQNCQLILYLNCSYLKRLILFNKIWIQEKEKKLNDRLYDGYISGWNSRKEHWSVRQTVELDIR